MSKAEFADLEAKLPLLSPAELQQLRQSIDDALKQEAAAQPTRAELNTWLGSLRGTVKFGPGWEDPLPAEDWEALR